MRAILVAIVAVGAVACGPPRSVDGSGNNIFFPDFGAAGTQLQRLVPSDYGDGVSSMAGASRPSPRAISNAVHAQAASVPNAAGASDFIWQWGQFLDHDIDLTGEADPAEAEPIPVPPGDLFDPPGTIGFHRSVYDLATGTGPGNPRQQLNLISAFIDASNVYGSDGARADALRTFVGGRLATSAGDLLPFNTGGFDNAGGTGSELFLAGDVRANEQVALTSMHTLFMREHNRFAAGLQAIFPAFDDEPLYQAARKWIGALLQSITYREYLPALLGPHAPSLESFWNPFLDPQIGNAFSGALFRLGHSQLNGDLLRLDANGNEIAAGHLALRDGFFNPDEIVDHGIASLLRGLASQVAQNVDVLVIDDVRNFLFGPPGSGGFDLASLNIQRGRDHGLPTYNAARAAFGLAQAADYSDISSDADVQQRLEDAYGAGNVDDVDLWTGGLAEDHLPGALVGELIATALVQQFEALRDGDRQWYRRDMAPELADLVDGVTLADVIRFNTGIGAEIQDDVFLAP